MQKILEDTFQGILIYDNHWSFVADSKLKQFPNANFYYLDDDDNLITKSFQKVIVGNQILHPLTYRNAIVVSKDCTITMLHEVIKINEDHKIIRLESI